MARLTIEAASAGLSAYERALLRHDRAARECAPGCEHQTLIELDHDAAADIASRAYHRERREIGRRPRRS